MNFSLHFPLDLIMIPVQLIVVFFTLYYFFLSFFGLFKSAPKSDSKPEKSFAILVAAHNEENVICNWLKIFISWIILTDSTTFLSWLTIAPTGLRKWPGGPVRQCLKGLTLSSAAKALPWSGALPICSSCPSNMTR